MEESLMNRTAPAFRIPYLDNAKFLLIALVAAGHFVQPIKSTRFSYNIYFFIYTFHMPCFVFLSGLLAKNAFRAENSGKGTGSFRIKYLLEPLWLYFIFKILTHITEGLIAGQITLSIDFFNETGAPWYLLSLALWHLTLPALKDQKPAAVLAGSAILGLLSGYQPSVGSILALDRTLGFAPFFYAGYYFRQEDLDRFLSGFRLPLIAAALILSLFIGLTAWDLLWPGYRLLFASNYTYLDPALYLWGPLLRLLVWAAAAILSAGLLAAVPRKTTPFTVIGQRTLPIYILHRLIRDLMQYFGFYELVNVHEKSNVIGVLLLALLVTLLLGNRYFYSLFCWVKGLPFRASKAR